jgi:hypothetical protein
VLAVFNNELAISTLPPFLWWRTYFFYREKIFPSGEFNFPTGKTFVLTVLNNELAISPVPPLFPSVSFAITHYIYV